VQASGLFLRAPYPLYTESLVQVLPDSTEKTSWCLIVDEPRMLLLMKRRIL
jgi:hypothetical protein